MTSRKTIVLADDHAIFRRGLVETLSEHHEYEVLAEASDGEKAIESILQHRPDIAILDISMPNMDGLDVLIKGRTWAHPPIFVMLTMFDEKAYLEKALEYGAKGYLLKDNADQELVKCLETVSKGESFLSPGISRHLLLASSEPSELDVLSPTERRVFLNVAEYKTNLEISELLSVSVRTIENHRAHICKKLELKGPHALAQYITKYNKLH